MTAGRPKKYKTKKALADAIERYFRSISRTIQAQEAMAMQQGGMVPEPPAGDAPPAQSGQLMDFGQPTEIPTGKGYGALQRELNDTHTGM